MRRFWTPYEIEFTRLLYPEVRTKLIADYLGRPVQSVYNRAQQEGWKKSDRFMSLPASGRTTGRQGIGTRFKKGQTPWNKGKHFNPGGRSAQTRFKPGHRPTQWVPVGTVVVDPDGYLKRKVRDDAPAGQSRNNWKFVHVIHWERYRGPVPKGYNIVFRNGDKRDIRIANLEMISNAELMRRNTYHRYPKEIARVIQLRGVLTRQINKRAKHEESHC